MTSVPAALGTASSTPRMWVAAFGQKATSEPWKYWMVLLRPVPLLPAVPTL